MSEEDSRPGTAREVFAAFLMLGLTSFGGPIAHLGYFRRELVERRRWVNEAVYADIVALCQFLPGPASSQVGMALGIYRAGLPGALAAWTAFTLPSAIAMTAIAYGIANAGDVQHAAWLHGLKIAAVAIVAQAVWTMGRELCVGRIRLSIAIGAAVVCLLSASAVGQLVAIGSGGLIGWMTLGFDDIAQSEPARAAPYSLRAAIIALLLFGVLLVGLPLLVAAHSDHTLAVIDSFYRSGSLVFGGGHVVLPLLQSETVPRGWLSQDTFLAGYGAAQAMPGPLFTFAAFLGAAMSPAPNGWRGAAICLVAIFLPSFLLVVGALPFWDRLRHFGAVRAALGGVNAAVVGLLLAALYNPVFTTSITRPSNLAVARIGLALLVGWNASSWFVVLLCALATEGLAAI
jgi:chromate transporter